MSMPRALRGHSRVCARYSRISGRLLLGFAACMLFLAAGAAYADNQAAPARDLQKARESARQAGPSKDSLFICQLDASLFEAERALRYGQTARARQGAERVLAGLEHVGNPAVAAKLRTRAEAILGAAAKSESQVAATRQHADIAAARERSVKDQEAEVRALSARGWKALEVGHNEQARAIADEMLKIRPGDRDGLWLLNQASLGLAPVRDAKSVRAERKKAEDTLIKQINDEIIPPRDIVRNLVQPGKKDPQAAPAVKSGLPAWEEQIRSRLRDPITAEFHDATLADACRYFSELTDTTIVVDPGVGRTAERASLPRMTLSFDHWLCWVSRLWRVNYVVRDHAIVITGRGGLLDEPVARDYDIAGLLVPQRNVRAAFNGEIQLDDSSGSRAMLTPIADTDSAEPPPSKEAIGEGWVRFLRASIASDTWDIQAGQEQRQYTIAYRNGRIVVVHTPEVQEQVGRLLDNFRRARNLQVHVLTRFLQVRTDYLQQFDLDFGNDQALGFDSRPGAPASRTTSVFGKLINTDQVPFAKGGLDAGGGLTLSHSYLDDGALNAFLHAVLKRRKGTLLLAPRLTCFNTQRANFQSITNFNYVRSISSDNEPEIGNVPDGIVYDIQPFVSADRRYITLVLQPQLRTLVSLTTFQFIRPLPGVIGPERFVQVPEVALKSLATTVTVPDGGSVIAGGLSDVTENRGVATIPFASTIPVLQQVFRGWTEVEARTSLVIIVTATIVPDVFEQE